MRLATPFLIGAIAVCAVLGAYGWTTAAPDRASAVRPPRSGMALLKAFRCFKPTRKVVVVRGVEDNFSPKGEEPLSVRPALRSATLMSMLAKSGYDVVEEDHAFSDSIQVPAGLVSRGLFVIGLKPLRGKENDGFAIGDLSRRFESGPGRPFMQAPIPELDRQPGWNVSGVVRFARLDEIRFEPRAGGTVTLLDHLQDGGGWIDVQTTDDTSVDFMGAAFCVGPPRIKGATFIPDPRPRKGDMVLLGCTIQRNDRYVCEPFEGDTACEVSLPVACIRPDQEPWPRAFAGGGAPSDWTGGRLAAAPATPASRFRTIADADRYCAANLGKDWRVLGVQDAMFSMTAIGRGRAADFEPRAWVDVADQPHATCWARK
ncbi:hypothetical protein QO010_001327 [Caulobacter ginsengisoli]|uniref:Uncharacterized protein n=1 Tax=Caulobacter ginsengisoli TaxID=400775 RepID=A0ABU0INI0_9CAUL|nr:hypothetical protein [Caulobacter ginsengisoli]MDQ0463556.1 hypothetical protein [Caulobacter ginsengisoli]